MHAKQVYHYKNIKLKLYKNNAAIWFHTYDILITRHESSSHIGKQFTFSVMQHPKSGLGRGFQITHTLCFLTVHHELTIY